MPRSGDAFINNNPDVKYRGTNKIPPLFSEVMMTIQEVSLNLHFIIGMMGCFLFQFHFYFFSVFVFSFLAISDALTPFTLHWSHSRSRDGFSWSHWWIWPPRCGKCLLEPRDNNVYIYLGKNCQLIIKHANSEAVSAPVMIINVSRILILLLSFSGLVNF